MTQHKKKKNLDVGGVIPQRKWWQTALIVVALSALGFVLVTVLSIPADREVTEEQIEGMMMSLLLMVGLLVLTPVALHHDKREAALEPRYVGHPASLIAGLIIIALGFNISTLPIFIVVFISVCSRGSWRWSLSAVAVAISAYTVFLLLPPDAGPTELEDQPYWAEWLMTYIVFFVLLVILFLIGHYRGALRQQRREGVHNAQEAERDRIARDIHDGLSHRLSLISVYSGALNYRDDLSEEERKKIGSTIQNEAEAAVDEMRGVLATVRSTDTTTATVEELVAEARAAGDDVHAENLELPPLKQQTQQAVTRCVREGFTNARKHAPGKPVTVTVEQETDDEACIVISNPNPGQSGKGSGQGLVSIAQRLESVGGAVSVEKKDPFVLRLYVPVEA